MEKYSRFKREQIPYIVLLTAAILWLLYLRQYIPAGVIGLSFLVVFLVINQLQLLKRREWDKFVNDSIKKLKPAVVEAAEKAQFPIAAFTRDGLVSWYNEKFHSLVAVEILMDIDELIDVDPEKLWKHDIPEFITIEGQIFKMSLVKYTAAHGEFEEDMLLMVLMDATEVKKAEDRKSIMMLVEVDNLNEVLNSAPESGRPLISAAIEKKLLDYTVHLKGYMKRYSTSKSIVMAPFEVFRDDVKKKFPILDQIKAINLGNTIEPTLSIGVSYDNEHLMADGLAAEQAQELALGRGGDQVVIKRGEKLTFFGGNSREVEKKSRVRSRVIAHAMRDLINESGRIYIMGHTNPDLDCLGAAVGIVAIARSLGKQAFILMDEPFRNVADILRLIREEAIYKDVFIPSAAVLDDLAPNDLLIVVDVHSMGYVLNQDVAAAPINKVVIDHHRRAADAITGPTLSYIETYASSTSELVTELIQYIVEKPHLLKVEADALLAGIMVDTKYFIYKTGARTFEAASFLRKAGANTLDIRNLLSYDKELYLLKAAIVKTGEVEKGVALAVCPAGIKDPLIAAQAADEFLNLKGIHSSFVLAQDGTDVVISARSDGTLNVQVIMEKFSGGGHMTMSGARVKDALAEDIKVKIKEILNNTIMEDVEDESDTSQGRQERR